MERLYSGNFLQGLGNNLILLGVLTRISDIVFHLTGGSEDISNTITLVTQLLTFLTIFFGFLFSQIGRYQERSDERERRRKDKREEVERQIQLAQLVETQAENVRLRSEIAHEETLEKLNATHTMTQEAAVSARAAYSEANAMNKKIHNLQEQIIQSKIHSEDQDSKSTTSEGKK